MAQVEARQAAMQSSARTPCGAIELLVSKWSYQLRESEWEELEVKNSRAAEGHGCWTGPGGRQGKPRRGRRGRW